MHHSRLSRPPDTGEPLIASSAGRPLFPAQHVPVPGNALRNLAGGPATKTYPARKCGRPADAIFRSPFSSECLFWWGWEPLSGNALKSLPTSRAFPSARRLPFNDGGFQPPAKPQAFHPPEYLPGSTPNQFAFSLKRQNVRYFDSGLILVCGRYSFAKMATASAISAAVWSRLLRVRCLPPVSN